METQSVWALVHVCQSLIPDSLACMLLPRGASWDEAAVAFIERITDATGTDEKLTTAEDVKEFLDRYGDRFSSLTVLRVFPA